MNIMNQKFKVGDKVKIPTQKTKRTLVGLKESLKNLRADVNTKFLVVTKELHANDNMIGIENPNYPNGYRSFYSQDDLELYVEEMTIPKVLSKQLDGTIIEVQDIDGAIYKIGDNITVFTEGSPNKGRKCTIRAFRWNLAKTNICAITEIHQPNGIGINKIELFIEKPIIEKPVKVESNLEKALRLYPAGTKVKSCANTIGISAGVLAKVCNDGGIFFERKDSMSYLCIYSSLSNKWAEILEEAKPEFVLPEVWHIKVTPENIDIVQQYWKYKNPSSSIKLTTNNYIGFTRWSFPNKAIHMGWGRIVNLQLNPTSPSGCLYYNGIEITTEQFIEHVLSEKLNPEVDTFVLPEKWRIKRTLDNYKVINDWCNTNPVNDLDKQSKMWGDTVYDDPHHYIYSEVPDNNMKLFQRRSNSQDNSFTNITFEQFQQYVLFNGLKVGDFVKAITWSNPYHRLIVTDLKYINGQSIVFFKYPNEFSSSNQRILLKNVIKID